MIDRKLIFDAAKRRGAAFTSRTDVADMDAAIDAAFAAAAPAAASAALPPAQIVAGDHLTSRVFLELAGHEAFVLEAYKDSVGVWTWGMGVTKASGIDPLHFKDNPSTVRECIDAAVGLLRSVYIPAVLTAFSGCTLTETQFAAALSFHYNTGAIRKTSWVPLFKQGDTKAAREFLTTHYLNSGTLQARRDKEAALFFDGAWSQDGRVSIIPVSKPSYSPNFRQAEREDISSDLHAALGEPK